MLGSEFKSLCEAEQNLVRRGYAFTGFWTRRCPKKGCVHVFRVQAPIDGYAFVVARPCPACGWETKKTWLCEASRIFGKVSDKHQCGSKCLNAKGHSCDCSCGGANHGAGSGPKA